MSLGIVDANYNLYADFECEGRISDGGIFKFTSLCKDLDNNTVHMPRSDALTGRTLLYHTSLRNMTLFAMSNCFMEPYPGCTLDILK